MKIPKGEKGWVQYQDSNGNLKYLITSKIDSRSVYYLYEMQNGSLVKLGKASTPDVLTTKYQVSKKINAKSS